MVLLFGPLTFSTATSLPKRLPVKSATREWFTSVLKQPQLFFVPELSALVFANTCLPQSH
jgi:hypothetical protein